MTTARLGRHCYALTAACLVAAGCGDSGGPGSEPDPLQLAVGVIVDSATFRSQGSLALNLVPSDRSGQTFLHDNWATSVGLLTPSVSTVSKLTEAVEPADSTPVAAAILLDDSGSMRFSDPDRQRAAAAQLFWTAVLPARAGNVAALLDFGRGGAVPAPGFERTSLLAGFSSDVSVLNAALDGVQAVPGGATPLYLSATEVMLWMDSVVSSPAQRVLVVITDGEPSDQAFADSLFAVARALQVRVFAVGVGSAAKQDPLTSAAILAGQLAASTGGIYAAAEPAEELKVVLQTLAVSTSPERLLVRLHIDPTPARGEQVSGTVTISGPRGSATAYWSFQAE